MASTIAKHLTRDTVIADSGASAHAFNDLKWFSTINNLTTSYEMSSANGGTLSATQAGTVVLQLYTSKGIVNILNLHNVKYCPQAPINMLSLGQLRIDSLIVDGIKDMLIIKATSQEFTTFE